LMKTLKIQSSTVGTSSSSILYKWQAFHRIFRLR
jgi:hypothetical protein